MNKIRRTKRGRNNVRQSKGLFTLITTLPKKLLRHDAKKIKVTVILVTSGQNIIFSPMFEILILQKVLLLLLELICPGGAPK